MNWLPTFSHYPWTGCDVEGETCGLGDIEGVAFVISWRRWQLEISIGRRAV